MKIQAYKDKQTGKLFLTLSAYNKFLKEREKQLEIERQEKIKRDRWNEIINKPRLTATSVDDFIFKCKNLWNDVHRYMDTEILSIGADYSYKNIRCSHDAPIGCKSNWSDDKSLPSYYLGWSGKIYGIKRETTRSAYLIELCPEGFTSTVRIKIPGLNTGSGSGQNNFGFELRIYLADLPIIYEKFKKEVEDKDKLEGQLKILKEERDIYTTNMTQYISGRKEVIDIGGSIDNYNMEIRKLQEIVKIHSASLSNYRQEYSKEYTKNNPNTFDQIRVMEDQIKFIDEILKNNL